MILQRCGTFNRRTIRETVCLGHGVRHHSNHQLLVPLFRPLYPCILIWTELQVSVLVQVTVNAPLVRASLG